MDQQRIDPSKVTKPIQLLAAWLAGLIIINAAFLGAAAYISKPEWASGVLIVAAIVNVPLFLLCLFLLQTKFRPEMQEDQYYSSYLAKRYSKETATTEVVEITNNVGSASVQTDRIFAGGDVFISHRSARSGVEINDLLPSYKEIKVKLEKSGITISNTFGTNSKPGGIPSLFLVSFGRGADLSLFRKVVAICKEFGLEGVSFAAEDVSREAIYIGSYGYDFSPYLPVASEAFKSKILDKSLTEGELVQIVTGPDKRFAKLRDY